MSESVCDCPSWFEDKMRLELFDFFSFASFANKVLLLFEVSFLWPTWSSAFTILSVPNRVLIL